MTLQTLTNQLAVFALALACGGADGAAPAKSPSVCFWNGGTAATIRELVQHEDPKVFQASADLSALATKQLAAGPFSVVDKGLVPPSGDKHDFSTLGRYYWPDPQASDGLPWITIDGKTNPDYFNGKTGDTQRLFDLHSAVILLSRQSYFAGDRPAAERAALLLRTWFIDPATRMNPHARYAARYPGRWDGKYLGIHSTVRPFTDILDSVELLKTTDAWSAADQQAMVAWFSAYLDWLTTSEFGQQESAQKNNHSTSFDCLIVRLAMFTGKDDLAREVLEEVKHRRIDAQIEPDGSQPLELRRSKGWDYSRYNLEFMFRLAMLGDVAGIDLWHYQSADGRSIRRALDYVISNLVKDGTVDAEALKGVGVDLFGPMLQVAARVYDEPHYLQVMQQIGYEGRLRFNEPGLVNGVLGGAGFNQGMLK
ncbi:MAG: hypothetical protein JWM57_3468 [Phycisphaerales bacterium]|nr:hypothetical protein [Phycisphaerales bacterium]